MNVIKSFKLAVLFIAVGWSANITAQNNQVNDLISAGNYPEAISILERVQAQGLADQSSLVNLAYCYINTHDYTKAGALYPTILSAKRTPSVQHYYFGEVLLCLKKYAEAKEQFTKHLAFFPDDHASAIRAISCDSLALWNQYTREINLENKGLMNTAFEELAVLPSDDGLYYISNNAELLKSTGGSTIFTDPRMSFIFFEKEGTLSLFRPFGDSVSYQAFAKQGEILAIATKPARRSADGDQFGVPGIMIRDENRHWKPFRPEGTPVASVITHPCIVKDGTRIYFASDMPGGYGGSDLYYAEHIDGRWGKAINLGSAINTPGNEMFPWIPVQENILYFASDGHPGYGNLDIYSAEIQGLQWSTPRNLRYPFNSGGDDYGFIYGDGPDRGFFMSNRHAPSKGGNDIFSFSLPPEPPAAIPPMEIPPPADTVKLTAAVSIPPDTHYVFFRTSSAIINPVFDPGLDSLLRILQRNPEWRITITGWADPRGPEQHNNNLSAERALTIRDWFTSRGITPGRIITKPSGEAAISELKQIKYHVQLGYVKKGNGLAYFQKKTRGALDIQSFSTENGTYFYVGQGSIAEMREMLLQLRKEYKLEPIIAGFYKSYYLAEYRHAPCRRAEIVFTP